jgi:hypothetical protein
MATPNTHYDIFLDDGRDDQCNGRLHCRSYDEFTAAITERGLPRSIAFDHDLGERSGVETKSGYDCAKWLVAYCMERGLRLPTCSVHSQNPVGAENIKALLRSYWKHWQANQAGT